MNFSIAGTISRLVAPQHEVSCSWRMWHRLLRRLRERGLQGRRESGAFLLGRRQGRTARIVDFLLYDDIDPHSLEGGIVDFDGRYYSRVWEICQARGLSVVADVHVHPAGSGQSESDRQNPMISSPGHLALIIPDFAKSPVKRADVGMYRYLGAKRWEAIPAKERSRFLHIGV